MVKIIAVVPAYNEEATVGKVVKKIDKYVDRVIVVDDCSKDNTFKEAKEAGATVLRHIVNLGLGSTLKTGCEAAIGLKGDIIITIDGDGQHSPAEIPKLIEMLQSEKLDIVFGRRPYDRNMPLVKKLGNLTLDSISRILFGVDVKDTQTGYRVFTKEAYRKIKWDSPRYAVASEIVMNVGRNKLRYNQIPIKTIYLDEFKGTTLLTGIKILIQMLIWRLTK